MAPIVRAIEAEGRLEPWLVHTGQHYDAGMSRVFFDDLGLPSPNVNLEVGSGTHAAQTGAIMTALEKLVSELHAAIVVTVGDVNSTLAAALVSAKAGIPQAHVEAGLRSGDPLMPEEVNRVVTDRLADILFIHSDEAKDNLLAEGVEPHRIQFVGNVMIDSLIRLRPHWQGAGRQAIADLPASYGVVTLHRPTNVDDPATLNALLTALDEVSERLPLIFPVHPRTARRLPDSHRSIRMVEPLGYLAFLDLLEHARLVLTDSGGIQEETTVLGVPCLTVRDNTERPVTVRAGTNRVIGTRPEVVKEAALESLDAPNAAPMVPPLWDGHAAERIAPVLANWAERHPPLRLQI
jgi:UDP-N-acetylglucosamine 2-epimerase (non-hydrolysing)